MNTGDKLCGIVGYAGYRKAYDIVLEGLKTWNTVMIHPELLLNKDQGCLEVAKVAGAVSLLEQQTGKAPLFYFGDRP